MTAGVANDGSPDLRPPPSGRSAIPSISCKRYRMHGHRALPWDGAVAVGFDDDRYAVQPCRLRWDMGTASRCCELRVLSEQGSTYDLHQDPWSICRKQLPVDPGGPASIGKIGVLQRTGWEVMIDRW
jgi:hypothetical protein